MAWPGGWHRCAARDALPLLVSVLIHLSLIGFFSPGRTIGAAANAEDAASGLRLNASLARPVALAPERPPMRRASVAAPLVEPAPRVIDPALSAEPLAASAPALPPAASFYPANELTIKPVALGEPALDGEDMVSGEVVLALWIDAQGTVVEVSVERSELPADRLPVVADAFRVLRFSPGELNGRAVGAVMRIVINYDDERLPMAP